MAIIPHDAWGNPLPRPEDRIKRLTRLVTPGPDARDAEILALRERIAELEALLTVTKPVTASNAQPVTPVTPQSTKLTPAEKQRRYRERLKNKNSA
jgi:hypothetical protein